MSSTQKRVLKRMQRYLEGKPLPVIEKEEKESSHKSEFVITDIENEIIKMIKQGITNACELNFLPLSLDNPIEITVRKHMKDNREVYASPIAMILEHKMHDNTQPPLNLPEQEKKNLKKLERENITKRSNEIAKIITENIKPNPNFSFGFSSGFIQATVLLEKPKEPKKKQMIKQKEVEIGVPHNLQVITEPSCYSEEKYRLFRKFQINIHNESPEEVTPDGYRNFLVDTPLIPEPVPEGVIGPTWGYGSFHMKYYLDGILVACSVMDFLPKGINSVYFMWDTDYKDLCLGIYSALKDIEMIKSMPSLQYYYLGWYVHTCPKMNYKSSFKPCELLCPVTHKFVPLDSRVRLLLDLNGYSQLDFENKPYSYRNEVVSRNVICKTSSGIRLSGSNHYFESRKSLIEEFVDYVGPELAQKIVVQFK